MILLYFIFSPFSSFFLVWTLFNCVELKAMELKKKIHIYVYRYISIYYRYTSSLYPEHKPECEMALRCMHMVFPFLRLQEEAGSLGN